MARIPAVIQKPKITTRPGKASTATIVKQPELAPPTAQAGSRARRKVVGLKHGERRLLQAATDWVVIMVCVSGIFLTSTRGYPNSHIAFSLGVVSFLWFLITDAFDTYKSRTLQSKSFSAYSVAQVLFPMGIAYIIISWLVGGFMPVIRPRISEMVTALLLLLPLLLARSVLAMVLSRGPLRRRIAVVGANADGYEMVDALLRYPGYSYEFVGFYDDVPTARGFGGRLSAVGVTTQSPSPDRRRAVPALKLVPPTPNWRVFPISDLITLNANEGLDQIVLANPDQNEELLYTLSICHEQGVQITPMFAIYQDLTGRVPVAHLGKDWFVALPANVKETTRSYRVVKRLLDIALAVVGIVLTAPLVPLLSIAIKLDSPGPVLFKQRRVGLGGYPFYIHKFRSMRANAEAGTGAIWAKAGDSRITRVGRVMRRSRLDEIPQLWNVLVGDMSIVGPRPERPEFDEELEKQIPFYRARRAVRPGLTGWAQVRYGYGNSLQDALRKVEYDLYYIKNESLYLDMMILVRTVATVLKLGGT